MPLQGFYHAYIVYASNIHLVRDDSEQGCTGNHAVSFMKKRFAWWVFFFNLQNVVNGTSDNDIAIGHRDIAILQFYNHDIAILQLYNRDIATPR